MKTYHTIQNISRKHGGAAWATTFRSNWLKAKAMRIRFDTVPLAKHLHIWYPLQYPSAKSTLCPPDPDGEPIDEIEDLPHALGGCKHDIDLSMFCRRHGSSVHCIQIAVEEGVTCQTFAHAEGHTATNHPVSPLSNSLLYAAAQHT